MRALFLAPALRETAPAMAGWLDAGHEIAGMVVPSTARRRFQNSLRHDRPGSIWSTAGILARRAAQAPVVFVNLSQAEEMIVAMIKSEAPDIIVSTFWPRKLPQHILNLPPLGAVNLHSALLPQYRGPTPLVSMILADELAQRGGMTLHVMEEAVDRGAIIAQAPLPKAAQLDANSLKHALGSAMYRLVRDDLPDWADNRFQAAAQSEGGFWVPLGPLRFSAQWRTERLIRTANLLLGGRSKTAEVEVDGEVFPLPAVLRRVSAATGMPAQRRRGALSFDCADGRIVARPMGHLARLMSRRRASRALERSAPMREIVTLRGEAAPGAGGTIG